MSLTETFAKQLDSILSEYEQLAAKSALKDLSDLSKSHRQALVTRTVAAIRRISGPSSAYSDEVARLISTMPHVHLHLTSVMGVAQALRDDLRAGFIGALVELVHGEVFADFLEMAAHLEEAGYKDAAAVVAGSTLEGHLRELCRKAAIPVEAADKNGRLVPKKANTLNAELAKAKSYSKLDEKSVTAWLDLRNNAAHGAYDQYDAQQVRNMIEGIRGFIGRTPA